MGESRTKPLIHHERDKHKQGGTPILCTKCHKPGDTLLKIDDHYEHQNKELCRIFQGESVSTLYRDLKVI